ncbi:NAD+ synthetase [Arhodomonas aquaeolei]|uniref:nitrilase-related carbon-nitrogen hydrolase n=1 Tax=Arhodomonas aquaeolei TaxID=2369 RepID=UPI002169FD46|nr:nitrilase-related carbon-nitrogen hydrolase [Arhodomonas aquaeolei]MCS4504346.1 NAD+ synthetase [Arhodomonas aquaeolei]
MTAQTSLLAGAAQINCALGEPDTNLDRHLEWIARARAGGVGLLVFPELSLTGYGLGRRVPDVAMHRDHPRLVRLAEAADGITVVAGFIEAASPGEYYNAVAVVRDGELAAVHRKLNLPTYGGLEEGKHFHAGRGLTEVALDGGWRASPLICADLWNPGLVHAAMLARPEVLIAPVNSASGIVSESFSNERNWLTNITFYAMTYATPVIMANRYGPEGDSHFWGGSRILDPRGEVLAAADDGEALVTAQLDREAIARARYDMPTHRDADTPLVRRLLEYGDR